MNDTTSSVSSDHAPRVITVTLTPVFKLVFLSVLGVTLLSMILGCSLAVIGGSNPEKTAIMQACLTTWKIGFGAIVGLLSGKAI